MGTHSSQPQRHVSRIGPLDEDTYAQRMKSHGQYVCTVKLTLFPKPLVSDSFIASERPTDHKSISQDLRLCFSQKSCRPSQGSIERVGRQYWFDGAKWTPSKRWPTVIHVRAMHQKKPPTNFHAEILDGDASLHSIKYAMQQSLAAEGTEKEWLVAMQTVRVCFLFRPDAQDAKREKWILEQSAQTLKEEGVLGGFNCVLAVQNIFSMLRQTWRHFSRKAASAICQRRLSPSS